MKSTRRQLVVEVQVGTHMANGTEWPVVDQVIRDQHPGGPATWEVVRSLCNGVPAFSTSHTTRREALGIFGHEEAPGG